MNDLCESYRGSVLAELHDLSSGGLALVGMFVLGVAAVAVGYRMLPLRAFVRTAAASLAAGAVATFLASRWWSTGATCETWALGGWGGRSYGAVRSGGPAFSLVVVDDGGRSRRIVDPLALAIDGVFWSGLGCALLVCRRRR